jgi:hypothetical protein
MCHRQQYLEWQSPCCKVYVLCYESKFQEIGISPIHLMEVQHFKLKKNYFAVKALIFPDREMDKFSLYNKAFLCLCKGRPQC